MINRLKLNITIRAVFQGVLATLLLLTLYFTVVSLVSGWAFAQDQFSKFWYFIVALAFGFGIQVALFSYLKNSVKQNVSSRVVTTSGVTSTAAMISCCSHYLANILPILGITGFITIVTQYQIQLFWVGLVANLGGIFFLANKIYGFGQ